MLSVMLSIAVLTNEVWIAWKVSFIVIVSNGLMVSGDVCFFHLPRWVPTVVMWWHSFPVPRHCIRYCTERRFRCPSTCTILVSM